MSHLNMKITALALCISASACVGDKTDDQYRQEKVNQQLAKIQAIEGVYTGDLSAARDNLSMGNIAIEFHPNTQVQSSSDNTSSEQKATVQGSIKYTGLIDVNVDFQQGYYDDRSGLFHTQISIIDTSGTPITLTIKGSISGSYFTGRVFADKSSTENYGATFTLLKGAPAGVAQNLVTGRVAELRSQAQSFSGVYVDPVDSKTKNFKLSLIEKAKHAQVFANLFLPERDIRAVCNFGIIAIPFDSVQLDETGDLYLDAQTDVADSSGAKFSATLKCKRAVVGGETQNLSCTFSGTSALVLNLRPDGK